MSPVAITSIILFAIVILFLANGVWVAISLLISGIVALVFFTPAPAGSFLSSTVWDASSNWSLAALPLFIWMGQILFHSRISKDMFEGLTPWVSPIPGRLLHVNVLSSGLMAAVTGSSAATAATVGRISIPELAERGYNKQMMIGTLAGPGTLGLLIPPSIVMIVYGITAQQSIGRLFIAGIVPGVLLIILFIAYVIFWAIINPNKMPVENNTGSSFQWKIWNSRKLIAVVLLFLFVLGSIYGGIATPTEAATVGVVGALVVAAVGGTLTWTNFIGGLLAATRTSCMIAFIIVAASALTRAVGFVGIPQALASWIDSLNLSYYALLAIIATVIVIMGCFLEGISIIVLTSSVILPMVQLAGVNLVWFGVFITILIEAAQITPPVGFNLFVLQSLTGRNIWQVARATAPFYIVLVLLLVVITVFPEIVMWLPASAH